MKNSSNIKRFEIIAYSIIWLIILFMPVFFSRSESGINWNRVYSEWLRLLPFMIIFLVNNYILLPFLLLKKEYAIYIAIAILCIFTINYLSNFSHIINDILSINNPERSPHPPPMHHAIRRPMDVVLLENIIIS